MTDISSPWPRGPLGFQDVTHARPWSAESLLQEYGDFLAGLGLPDDLAEGCPQRQPMGLPEGMRVAAKG